MSNAGEFSIGQFAVAGASSFQGAIDEVGIYNRALSQSELQSIVNAGSSGKCKPSPLNPPMNQIAWFTGDGDTRDFTGLNSNGTLQGDTNYKIGKVGQSFNFDDNGDYVSTADSPNWDFGTGDFAIEGWFNAPNPTGVQRIISAGSQTDGANNLWSLGYGDIGAWGGGQRLNFAVFNGGGYSDFSSNQVDFRPNTWHHAAVVRTGTSFTFYLDGAAIGTVPVAAGFAINGGSTGAIIGARYNTNPSSVFEFANGRLDEISVYNRALSVSEVSAVYNAGTAGKLKSAPVNFVSPSVAANAKRATKAAAPAQAATAQLSDATVMFANITSSGTVSENGIDLGLLPPLPLGATLTGLAYDISTTAGYQNGSPDDVKVCFNLPSLAAQNFANLRIFHLETTVWVNRTVSGNISPNLCTDNLTSLSPFVIAQVAAPTAANASIAGKVTDEFGRGIRNAKVMMTNSQGRILTVLTGSFGYYRFAEVPVGEIYTVGVSAKKKYICRCSTGVKSDQCSRKPRFHGGFEKIDR